MHGLGAAQPVPRPGLDVVLVDGSSACSTACTNGRKPLSPEPRRHTDASTGLRNTVLATSFLLPCWSSADAGSGNPFLQLLDHRPGHCCWPCVSLYAGCSLQASATLLRYAAGVSRPALLSAHAFCGGRSQRQPAGTALRFRLAAVILLAIYGVLAGLALIPVRATYDAGPPAEQRRVRTLVQARRCKLYRMLTIAGLAACHVAADAAADARRRLPRTPPPTRTFPIHIRSNLALLVRRARTVGWLRNPASGQAGRTRIDADQPAGIRAQAVAASLNDRITCTG
jgi:hypothetical protein